MKRLFKGLNREIGAAESYDAIVIGSGIGGLTCANILASKGIGVLLVEQNHVVGGYCSTIRRNGFHFDRASHSYPLLGNPDTITGGLLTPASKQWLPIDPVEQFHLPMAKASRSPPTLRAI